MEVKESGEDSSEKEEEEGEEKEGEMESGGECHGSFKLYHSG